MDMFKKKLIADNSSGRMCFENAVRVYEMRIRVIGSQLAENRIKLPRRPETQAIQIPCLGKILT
ncbi:hypothetical protein D3C87_1809290 [compost metagenome]